ncbi:MAG: hypothetical protein ACRC0M_03570 [Legionella sp.]
MLKNTYKNAAIGIIIFLGSANSYSDSDNYLCITKHTIGFKYNSKINDWQITNFKGSKYIISKCNDPDKKSIFTQNCKYKLTEFGNKQPSCGCTYNPKASILCFNLICDFKFSLITGKFIEVSSDGYWNPNFEMDTPYLGIGYCSPF